MSFSATVENHTRGRGAAVSLTLQQVHQERNEQVRKWGVQDHSPEMWLAILTEEVGEVAKEIAESHVKPFNARRYRQELIQVAAVAAAAIESMDYQS
jgi:NTP pyrophosphatase (non-canonical NTP hydrolase)